MKTIFCLFRDLDTAQSAIDQLVNQKFPSGEMNVIVQAQTAKNVLNINPRAVNIPVTGEGNRHPVPTLEKMLHGKQPVQIPDTGKVFASGELANLLTRSASTSAENDSVVGLKSALVDFGLPSNTAGRFYEGIKGGGILFFIRTSDERSPEAANFLRTQDGSNLVTHVG